MRPDALDAEQHPEAAGVDRLRRLPRPRASPRASRWRGASHRPRAAVDARRRARSAGRGGAAGRRTTRAPPTRARRPGDPRPSAPVEDRRHGLAELDLAVDARSPSGKQSASRPVSSSQSGADLDERRRAACRSGGGRPRRSGGSDGSRARRTARGGPIRGAGARAPSPGRRRSRRRVGALPKCCRRARP